jgi:hypothetical protein
MLVQWIVEGQLRRAFPAFAYQVDWMRRLWLSVDGGPLPDTPAEAVSRLQSHAGVAEMALLASNLAFAGRLDELEALHAFWHPSDAPGEAQKARSVSRLGWLRRGPDDLREAEERASAIDDPTIRARERFSNLYERACRQSAGGDDWITTLSVAGGLVQPPSADALGLLSRLRRGSAVAMTVPWLAACAITVAALEAIGPVWAALAGYAATVTTPWVWLWLANAASRRRRSG